MRGIGAAISRIEEDAGDLLVLDQEAVLRSVLRAAEVFFLDTGFFARLALMETDVYLPEDDFAFVLTELVLYELADVDTMQLKTGIKTFLGRMHEDGKKVLVLKEKSLVEGLGSYITKSTAAWNGDFISDLQMNKASLTKLAEIVSSPDFVYRNVLENGYNVPTTRDFIVDFFEELFEGKTGKDSLAEELIIIVILILMKLPRGGKMYYCSHDHASIARFNKALQNTYSNGENLPKAVTMLSYLSFLVEGGVLKLDDCEALSESLRRAYGSGIKVAEVGDLPAQAVTAELSPKKLAEGLLSGKRYILILKA